MEDYRTVNRENWDERVPAHLASPDYEVGRYAEDPSFLSHVVRFDVPRLGDIRGLRGVHLQCHIGTDTVSLARLGASMTGLDFSAPAVAGARRLAELTGADARFVQADVYAAPDVLGKSGFDLVFTGIGALCWLPDIRRWAEVVAALLRPGGRLFLREGHPMLWTVDEFRTDGTLAVEYPYFERKEPLVLDGGGHVRRDRRGVPAQRHALVEPRPGRDHHGPDGRRTATHRADRARQHSVAGLPRPDGADRRR